MAFLYGERKGDAILFVVGLELGERLGTRAEGDVIVAYRGKDSMLSVQCVDMSDKESEIDRVE